MSRNWTFIHTYLGTIQSLYLCKNMSQNLQLVIDTDVGLDDALALMLCLASEAWNEAKIHGVTCVHGNTCLENVCSNTLKVLHAAGRLDIPVFRGASESLVESPESRAEFYHGCDGFGDFQYPDAPDPDHHIQKDHAVSFLTKITSERPNEISLLCLGPLTNIALAIHMDPRFCTNVKEMVIMGGNIAGVGNITAAAEFNFHCDPEAAHVVLKSMKCPITIFPWETALTRTNISYRWRNDVLGKIQSPQMQLLNQAEAKVIARHYKDGWVQCDPAAAAILMRPSIASSKVTHYVMVELHGRHTRGAMVLDHINSQGKKHNVTIIESIDLNLYKELLLTAAKTNLSRSKIQKGQGEET
ncbi:uncharacterized protein C1683.06c-like isoform X1 [Schistocerca piceifrons]|uniref:uncharacterized protein C1683.06c-like isoform X1 n=2 Tax=Schistocerca piceifrons TaxID=274613 RepID=UPI001F5E4578|nr:uncharacterized protein C1683.06c-like isoform X1 [Schistocerca piceifrons]